METISRIQTLNNFMRAVELARTRSGSPARRSPIISSKIAQAFAQRQGVAATQGAFASAPLSPAPRVSAAPARILGGMFDAYA
jgi:hypothetical protein